MNYNIKEFPQDNVTSISEDNQVYKVIEQIGHFRGAHMAFGTLFIPAISDEVAKEIGIALESRFDYPVTISRSEPTEVEPFTEHSFDF